MSRDQKHLTEMKNAFYEFISKLGTAKERTIELKIYNQLLPKSKCKEEKKQQKKQQNILELWDNYNGDTSQAMGIPEGEERERNRSI